MTSSRTKSKHLKVALVCDWLTASFGGAEQVLLALHELYPDAPIYTSQASRQGITVFGENSTTVDVRTGWLQIFPSSFRRILGPLRQFYFSHLDLSSYDLVISVTGAEAKSVRTTARKKVSNTSLESRKNRTNSSKTEHSEHRCLHLCYCHVPTQYYWGKTREYQKNPGFGALNFLIRPLLKLLLPSLKRADLRAASRPDIYLAPSNYAREQIEKHYKREALVIHPPVAVEKFSTTPPDFSTSKKIKPGKSQVENRSYYNFINVSRQVSWKRLDILIEACLATGHHLTLIGDGPEHQNLTRLAHNSPLISFKSPKNAQNLQKLYHEMNNQDKFDAFLFPSLEPFGIAPVEALAAGLPVIAFAEGGAKDYIEPGKNGLLFPDLSAASLAETISAFNPVNFSKKTISTSAKSFSTADFKRKIKEVIRENLC